MNAQNPGGEPPAGEPTGGQPATPVAPSGEKPTSSGSEVTLESLAVKLDALDKRVGKRQSAKDKAIDDVKGDVASLRADFARYEELRTGQGMTPEDAEFRIRMEQVLASQGGVEPPSGAAPQTQAPGIDTQAVLSAVGLDAADPEVTTILGQSGDPTPALIALSNKRKMPPNPAGVMPTAGGPAPKGDLWEQYQKEVAPLRANRDSWAIAQLQSKYAKLGLQV